MSAPLLQIHWPTDGTTLLDPNVGQMVSSSDGPEEDRERVREGGREAGRRKRQKKR